LPELPEAETIVRTLRSSIEGRRILAAEFLTRRVSAHDPLVLAGATIVEVSRYGKQILLRLDRGCIRVKLGMTGKLLTDAASTPYTRARIQLDSGVLLFDDIRQFGSISILEAPPSELGPDPFEITAREFAVDQSFVRGVGNIYADEALFRAAIHPRARTRALSRKRAEALHAALCTLLRLAIEHRGSSVRDYVDASGGRGGFQRLHQVYRRHGEACHVCGSAIRRTVVAQRGTHFCPACQRR
jgi:formamidopyrimidine-DNA glycosylase